MPRARAAFIELMKPLLIVNPVAGQGKPEQSLDAVVAAFRPLDPEVFLTGKAGDAEEAAARAARSGDFDSIIVAGGDGTVNEVVNGFLAASGDLSLAIVPTGTQNVLAYELGLANIPLDRLCSLMASGKSRSIDVGKLDGRYFTLMAGFGFDAVVVRDVQRQIKDLIGPAAYALSTLAALTKYRSTSMRLTLDGETFTTEAFLLIVANSASYAYHHVKLAPFASLDDGWLDICVFERPPTDRFGFAAQVVALFTSRHLRDPRVRYYRARSIKIDSVPSAAVQLDGDIFGSTPVSIEVVPRALSVFAP